MKNLFDPPPEEEEAPELNNTKKTSNNNNTSSTVSGNVVKNKKNKYKGELNMYGEVINSNSNSKNSKLGALLDGKPIPVEPKKKPKNAFENYDEEFPELK